jgi:hypothetical protein
LEELKRHITKNNTNKWEGEAVEWMGKTRQRVVDKWIDRETNGRKERKVNVYLSSLMMKVPDHVYVLHTRRIHVTR